MPERLTWWQAHYTRFRNAVPQDFATVTGTTTIVLTLVALGTNPASAADTPRLEYNRDVRPILAENCFACHGPDSAARKAEMRLDRRDDAMKAGAISPGNLDESELVARINAQDPKELMPPPVTTKKLTQEQKDILKRWIAGGAAYQPHWSLIPPKRPALPAVRDLAWVRNPIDRFVLTKLEEKGLHPAPEANRRTLARRLSLDLTGLPPEPAVVEAFVQDSAPDAYESLVTRFLDSPSWGEHRARYWLDYSRYADTNGYHFDNFREAWAFRDWVIGAFNRNLSFDRFTIEQLAGDLLPGSTLDQQVASGFNRCNSTTNEGGVIPEEYTVLYVRIGPRRSPRCGWASQRVVLSATTTSSIRSASASFTNWPRSSTTRPSRRWTATSRTRRRPSLSPVNLIGSAGRLSPPSLPRSAKGSKAASNLAVPIS